MNYKLIDEADVVQLLEYIDKNTMGIDVALRYICSHPDEDAQGQIDDIMFHLQIIKGCCVKLGQKVAQKNEN